MSGCISSCFGQSQLSTSPEQVTASWLTEVLGQKIKTIELTKSVLNESASKLFITLTYDNDAGLTRNPEERLSEQNLGNPLTHGPSNASYPVSSNWRVYMLQLGAHEMRILDHYLDALSSFGGLSLSSRDEDVWTEYRKSTLAGYQWILVPYELQSEARVRTMVARLSTAIVDHKTVELIESLPDAS
ncbi:hypothetical protein F4781DRAFT_440642 [Annulohypoxylon bovei var. microspora]|nr:hypothetical protein F4781DRAFT_440642 [Annulohypoxylon bovei var. microspora]